MHGIASASNTARLVRAYSQRRANLKALSGVSILGWEKRDRILQEVSVAQINRV
jgi:hypothetical protein